MQNALPPFCLPSRTLSRTLGSKGRNARDPWMLLIIPRRLGPRYVRVHRGKHRTPMEMLILCDSFSAVALRAGKRGYAIKPAIIVRTLSARSAIRGWQCVRARQAAAVRDTGPSGWTES